MATGLSRGCLLLQLSPKEGASSPEKRAQRGCAPRATACPSDTAQGVPELPEGQRRNSASCSEWPGGRGELGHAGIEQKATSPQQEPGTAAASGSSRWAGPSPVQRPRQQLLHQRYRPASLRGHEWQRDLTLQKRYTTTMGYANTANNVSACLCVPAVIQPFLVYRLL